MKASFLRSLIAMGFGSILVVGCSNSVAVQNGSMGAAPITTGPQHEASTIYDFTMKDIDGKDVPLSNFKGKVLLVVNVASFCGNTPQYEALEKLYKEEKDKGLVILGFPANEFGEQEPGSNQDIKKFCTSKYDVTFPMFSKIVVKGEGEHPLYKWLQANAPYHDDVEWNFGKFLVDRNGKVINRFAPKTKPDDASVMDAVTVALTLQK